MLLEAVPSEPSGRLRRNGPAGTSHQPRKGKVMNTGTASLIAIAAALALAGQAQAQRAKREAGAHVHGASKLNLAIEGRTISMELTAPADDIVGFETRPRTDKQRAAVEQATSTLRDPLRLFTLPPETRVLAGHGDETTVGAEAPSYDEWVKRGS